MNTVKAGKEGRGLFMRQWPSLWATAFGLMRSMAVVHNAGHWQFFKFNSRRCERRPLTKSRRSQRWSMPT